MPGVNFLQAGDEQAIQFGDHLEQAALDHLKALADLIDQLGPLGTDGLGEPEDLDKLADGIPRGLGLIGQ